jgi:hypothetical protein
MQALCSYKMKNFFLLKFEKEIHPQRAFVFLITFSLFRASPDDTTGSVLKKRITAISDAR